MTMNLDTRIDHDKIPPCVFIADDNPNNIKVLSTMLEAKGYEIRVALNGEQALQSIRQSKPDLILLDVHMPKMDGYEVCRTLKEDPDLKNISVIFISALNEPFNKIQGFKLGAVDYIEKPFQIEEVEVRIDTQLELRFYQNLLEEKAKTSEDRLRLATGAANIGIWEWETETDTLFWDERMKRIFGIENERFMENSDTWLSLIHDKDRERVRDELQKSLSENMRFVTEFKIVKPDQTIRYVRARADIVSKGHRLSKSMIGVAYDISDRVMAEERRKIMEARLLDARKMESMGTLAGGVAHDFKNILTSIFGYSNLALKSVEDTVKVEKHLKNIMRASKRANELIQQILTFSRKRSADKQPVRLGYLVDEVLNLIAPALDETVKVEKELVSQSEIMADPTRIHQVLMNLCTNANYAMSETGGTLRVCLSDIDIPHSEGGDPQKYLPGKYVKLEVTDTGIGIDPETLERVFEPYFTTKELKEGTGLGLAVAHGIVKDHNGYIEAVSESGSGASFLLYFPCL